MCIQIKLEEKKNLNESNNVISLSLNSCSSNPLRGDLIKPIDKNVG